MARTGRPPKDKSLLMNESLRITLTADQKDLIERAAKLVGLDMTAWARPILLEMAKTAVGGSREHRSR